MSALAEPLVRAAIGAVSKKLKGSSAEDSILAGPRQAGSDVALWDLVCRTVSVWADNVDHTQLRGFLQVSMTAARDKGCLFLRHTHHGFDCVDISLINMHTGNFSLCASCSGKGAPAAL